MVLLGLFFMMMSFVQLEKYTFQIPKHFPKPKYDFTRNPLDSNKVLLGRILFYDPILSQDGTISCASCHSPFNAFAHTDHALSHGIHDSIGTRNAPALFNLAWQENFMWDGAITHLDMQALAPITSKSEMGSSIQEVVAKLNLSQSYRKLFYQAYKDSTITGTRVLLALSQFQLTLVSATAKYDSVMLGTSRFTPQEEKGYAIFQKHCNTCHTEPLFSNYDFQSNGLIPDTSLRDYGRWNITHLTSDSLTYKVPSLRNLSYSYPYMHDGRFSKLQDVLQHYTTGIQHTSNLAKSLTQPIPLSSDQKVDLIAFLLTLNDKAFVFDKKHQYKKIPSVAKD